MGVPGYQTIMLPVLSAMTDGGVYRFTDVMNRIAPIFQMTDAESSQKIPSGQSTLYENRAGWARTYLTKAGLIERVSRGHFQITSRGLEVLQKKPAKIDQAILKQFPEFLDFIAPKRDSGTEASDKGITTATDLLENQAPLEMLELAYQRLRREVADDLLQTTRSASPRFFEELVVKLLVRMGYGGSIKDAGEAVGKPGDDGLDGIIKEDPLGLDAVYIQAKRWANVVGRPEVQSFSGSLEGHRARKGVFITTSQFSKEAREYVTRIERKILLIDGEHLAQLMIDYGVGVSDVETYTVKKIDRDYFEE